MAEKRMFSSLILNNDDFMDLRQPKDRHEIVQREQRQHEAPDSKEIRTAARLQAFCRRYQALVGTQQHQKRTLQGDQTHRRNERAFLR